MQDVLDAMAARIRACEACTARPEAVAPVPGYGRASKIMFVGRNPGATENLEGRPFVGPSGAVLDEFLGKCGLSRSQVFVTNLALCHTMEDRALTRNEVSTCVRLHLSQYLRLLRPWLVVAMGAECAKTLAGVKSIQKEHGMLRFNPGHKGDVRIPPFWVIPTLHPAAVLYDFQQRPNLDYDAVQVRRFLAHRTKYIKELEARSGEEEVRDVPVLDAR